MTQLMPEFERQLRDAARRLIDSPEGRPASRRTAVGGRLVIALSAAVAIGVAIGAVLLAGHRVGSSATQPGAALPEVQYGCARPQILRTRGRLATIAHGTVAGERWTLQADRSRRGLAAVQAGRLLLDGRAYGFCEGVLDIELVNAGSHGIVYGYASRSFHAPITVEAAPGRGTATHPVRAHDYPATIHSVPGGVLFLRALPSSACVYNSVAVAMPVVSTTPNAVASRLSLTGPFRRACAPGQLRQASRRP